VRPRSEIEVRRSEKKALLFMSGGQFQIAGNLHRI
jgi:hypothetical protein